MRNYDPVFHPVIVADRVFLPSNADDSVRCINLNTGELEWRFTADAPIRNAPSVFEGVAYFGSDDGNLYAVRADSGELMWKQEVQASPQRFINDGRAISFFPLRAGALIDPEQRRVMTTAGMFPWRSTVMAGLNLDTGEVEMHKDLGTGWTLEGSMLLSSKHVIAPQGRAAPQLFDRFEGESAGALPGGGGSFVILTDDEQILHGPGNKGGWITASNAESREKLATFDRGSAVIVEGDVAYLLDLSRLSALDRKSGSVLWSTPCPAPHELILAGDTLFAGGTDRVIAFAKESGQATWEGEVKGKAHGIALSNGHLIVSTDEGVVHAFTPTGEPQPAPDFSTAMSERQIPEISSPEVRVEEDSALLERWIFQGSLLEDCLDEDGNSLNCYQIASLAKDGRAAQLPHEFRFVVAGDHHAWLLNGNVDAEVAPNFADIPHPRRELTVETWVRIDKSQEWGGLLSMTQDNGSFEKGWILGFRQNRFGFALNGVDGPDRLTWLTDQTQTFELKSWHHVAGTYDGETIKLYVDGKPVAESAEQSGDVQYPPRAPFQLASYKDDDEHFHTIGMLNEVRLYERALTAEEIANHAAEKLGEFPAPPVEQVVTTEHHPPQRGPIMQFVRPGVASIQWWTEDEQPTQLEIVEDDQVIETLGDPEPTRTHQVLIQDLDRDQLLKYRIVQHAATGPLYSKAYECDRHFDYLRDVLPIGMLSEEKTKLARQLLDAADFHEPRGLALLLGANDEGRLAEALCREGGLDVIILASDHERAEKTRDRLLQRGVYGRPVSIRLADEQGNYRIPRQFADLLVVGDSYPSQTLASEQMESLKQWVKPSGAIACPFDALTETAAEKYRTAEESPISPELDWYVDWTPRAEGAAPWTHMYGSADNSAYVGETLSGAKTQEELQVLWAGRPGPRYQSDRGNRKPSPLAADGRLYMQGLHRLIAVNAYNGTILWAWELPEVVRFNVPRDCSNWCTDEESVFVTARNRCLELDGATGQLKAEHEVYQQGDHQLDWGYLSRQEELLIGSGVRVGNSFTEFWGAQYWYDSRDGEHATKVCSDVFFVRNLETGELEWSHSSGLIVNPTITIADGKVHFIECRSQVLMESESRRLEGDEFWQNLHLVTLDVKTGEQLWEIPAKPMPGVSALYLVAAEGKLVLQTSNDGAFAVYVIDAEDGSQVWRGRYDWEANHHGKHLSRPAVVNSKIYLRPLTLDLNEGTVLADQFPAGHQCGTYTASRDALFLRAGSLAMWDSTTGDSTRWNRVRPDCWISTIPAEGLLLSPEGGGGCSCGGWIETSMGFIPVERQP